MLLAGDQHRVEDATAVVHRDVADVFDRTGLGVDLDHGDVGTERERGVGTVEVELVGQSGVHALGALAVVVGGRREVAPGHDVGGHAGDVQPALALDDVVGGCLEQVRGEFFGLVEHGLAGDVECRAGGLQRARAHGAGAAGDEVGVGLMDRDLVHRHAEHVGDDHRERGDVALTVGAGAHGADDAAVLVDLDRAVLDVEAGGSGDLDVGGHADADLLAVARGPTLGLLCQQALVVGSLECGVERLLVLARVVVRAARRGQREGVGLQEVLATDLGGVDAEVVGGHVDQTLEELGGLGAPGAAVGGGDGRVRAHRAGVVADLRDLVDALDHRLGEDGEEATDRRVGAGFADDLDVEAGDGAVGAEAHLAVHRHAAALVQRDHVLGAGLGPLERLAELHGEAAGEDLLDVGAGLGAEATADGGGGAAHVAALEAERRGDGVTDRIGVLGGGPQGDLGAVAGDGDRTVVLDRDTGEALGHHADLGHVLGPLVGVAVLEADAGLEAHVGAVVLEQQG